ncbi:LamG domain-containing protein, partial [Patescibacteria group bacterium]|nr:LamG domain-containing protein [Patescibacteria group bacterium]MBU2464694.1 LamG domain-containing protein [Candidatus Edwardsbacteria bacterium]
MKLHHKLTYYIKYLHYLVKKLNWHLHRFWHRFTPKQLKIIGLTVAFIVTAITITPFVIKYLNTPRPLNLKKAASNTNFLYAAESKDLHIFVGEKNSNRPTVTLKANDTSLISFTLTQTNPDLSKPQKKGNQLTFTDVRQGVNLQYQTLANGIKEEIILTQPGQGNSFSFDTEIFGANPKMLTREFFGPVFFDADDNYLFHFQKPYAYDSAGNRTDEVLIQVQKQKQNGNLYKTIITVPLEWLNDPFRVYPVYIDPTVVHDETAEFATGSFNRAKDTGSGASPSIETYYQELPADINTVGLWHMNEASGNALDSSGNGNTGTPTGTTVVAGLLGNARSFNGTSDNISLGNPTSLQMTGNQTIEMWLYPTDMSARRNPYAKAYGGEGTITQEINGTLSYYYGTAGANTTPYQGFGSVAAIPLNQWSHIALVRNLSTMQLYWYINGVQVSNVAASYSSATVSSLTAYIGQGYVSNYAGSIDEVRISNIARTPEEIKLDASRRPYSTYTSPVVDFGVPIVSWNSLSWNEWGVATGDGETVFS